MSARPRQWHGAGACRVVAELRHLWGTLLQTHLRHTALEPHWRQSNHLRNTRSAALQSHRRKSSRRRRRRTRFLLEIRIKRSLSLSADPVMGSYLPKNRTGKLRDALRRLQWSARRRRQSERSINRCLRLWIRGSRELCSTIRPCRPDLTPERIGIVV